jgi:hypothetical protein
LHHADPTCARHGVGRGQLDPSARIIAILERLGWATTCAGSPLAASPASPRPATGKAGALVGTIGHRAGLAASCAAGTPRANVAVYQRGRGYQGGTGYPMVRLQALLACGTHTVVDAVFGPTGRRDQLCPRSCSAGCAAG